MTDQLNPVPLPDEAARRRALDPSASFIVQAPAGSGKTTLLTHRFLTLLSRVERPESVLAITFTTKAAAEMRARVLNALARAERDESPKNPSDATTLSYAKAVLTHARHSGWDLERQPGRLRIQTIDSLNYWLADRLPVLSKAGVRLSIESRAKPLYREAAHRTLQQLETPGPLADALARVLEHFDNEVDRVAGLLADMLERRERWLEEVMSNVVSDRHAAVRERLERTLQERVRGVVNRLALCAGPELLPTLLSAMRTGSRTLMQKDVNWQVVADCPLDISPADPAAVGVWQLLGASLLTKQGEWRKKIGATQGFSGSAKTKDADRDVMVALLQSWSVNEELRQAWWAVMALPSSAYPQADWEVVAALHSVLVAAAQQLRVLFAERGQVDFVEVSHSALQALGSADEPTDLTLMLDERIQHLLVDEFQDTSITQVRLLKQLTTGWSPGDGRTLFLVGDPMQSIYGFRAANISLFLGIQQQGLGALRPESLVLQANFRSRPALIQWFNEAFSRAFPAVQDLERGAITYAASAATRAVEPDAAVHWHVCEQGSATDEAREVIELVRAEQTRRPHIRLAVLGRSRSQLTPVAAALRAAGIAFHGIDLAPLAERLVVRDLVSLTRAILHLGDRIAWLACLRAPWCGLSLSAIDRLLADSRDSIIWPLLCDPARLAGLEPADARRVERLTMVLGYALAQRGRGPLSACIESAWLGLGGPATLTADVDLANARAFFVRLDHLEQAGDLLDPPALEQALEDLYGAPDPGASAVQLLTIHRAKGLEWDVVILTGLARTTRASDSHLLEWLEFATPDSEASLLMAPHRARTQDNDQLQKWLRGLAKEREHYEVTRLLYVAATRAQERLYLVSHGKRAKGDAHAWAAPAATSLLGVVWPSLSAQGPAQVRNPAAAPVAEFSSNQVPSLQRLPADFSVPQAWWRGLNDAVTATAGPSEFEFEWVTATARHVGSLVHEELERVARQGIPLASAFDQRETSWRQRLLEWGVGTRQLEAAVERTRRALHATAADERGHWLLCETHAEAACELDLSTLTQGRVRSARIDRTFVDQSGIRWIVDYKTSEHEGTDLQAFLDREQERYRAQLEYYATLIAAREPSREIRLGLYFPLHSAWREWIATTPS